MTAGNDMKILLTGVAGFVGTNFANYILENDPTIEIVGVDNLCTGFRENVDARIKFYQIDLLDHVKLEELFLEHEFYAIVHMAAFAAETLSPFCRRFCYNNNVIASTNLINAAINHSVKKFIFLSSIASYGDICPPFKEDDIPNHCDIYGLTKYVTVEDLKIAAAQHGLVFVVFKPFNIYGPYQALNSRYRNVAGIFMNKILEGETLSIYGDGEQTRAFSYIDDILPPIHKALIVETVCNQIYNIGSSKFYSVNEIADTIVRVTGKGKIQYLEGRHEVKDAYCDVTKVKRELGFVERTTLEEGITKMWKWAQTAPRRPVEKFSELEVTKGLYSFWT